MLRVGLVGLGSIGRRHLGNLLALGADVVAMDVSPEAIETARAAYPHARYGDSLPFSRLDALVIATPLDSHLPWVEEAVARRLPFFVEKPLGTLEQLPRWREIAAMDLPVNQVGYCWRFNEFAIQAAATMRARGNRAAFLNCDTNMADWPGSAKHGPPLLECSHEIDLALSLFGGGDLRHATLYEGRQYALLFAPFVEVRLVWANTRHQGRSFMSSPSADGLYPSVSRPKPESIDAMYRAEMAHFFACVRDGTPTICPLADGLRVLEVCAKVEAVA
jgi:predicted dehydrogenase